MRPNLEYLRVATEKIIRYLEEEDKRHRTELMELLAAQNTIQVAEDSDIVAIDIATKDAHNAVRIVFEFYVARNATYNGSLGFKACIRCEET